MMHTAGGSAPTAGVENAPQSGQPFSPFDRAKPLNSVGAYLASSNNTAAKASSTCEGFTQRLPIS